MPIQPTTRLSSVIQRQGLVNSDVSLNSNPEALPSPKSATPLHTNLSASLTSSSEPQPTPPTATASALPEAITSLTHIRPSERDNNQADDSTVDGSSNTTDSNTTTVVQQADIPVRIQQQRTRSTAFSLQSRQALPKISDSDSDYENESDDENESDSAENHANPFMSAIRPKDLGENTYRVDGQDGAVINNDIRETGLHLGSKDNNVSNVSFKDGVVRFVWSPPRVCAQDVFDPSFHLRHNGTDMLSMPGNPSCKLQYITVHDCLKVHTNGLNGSDSTKKRIQFLQKMFTSTPRAIQLRMSGAIGLTDTKSISVNLGDHTFWFNTALTEMRVDAVTQFVEGSHTRMLNIITIKMFPDMYNTDEERIQANCAIQYQIWYDNAARSNRRLYSLHPC
ncbi:hypothetical protein J3E72DRAFT_271428 [Bipolaris maydis]|nr:hypothetical protein J3E72DRAFT_271428 [Bipolaris maydis]